LEPDLEDELMAFTDADKRLLKKLTKRTEDNQREEKAIRRELKKLGKKLSITVAEVDETASMDRPEFAVSSDWVIAIKVALDMAREERRVAAASR
jgi:uncharacterized protein YlxP (DUF503 family)